MIRFLTTLVFLLVGHSVLNAATLTQAFTNNTPVGADGLPGGGLAVEVSTINVPIGAFPAGALITDVDVTLNFDKIDAASAAGCPTHNGGNVYNDEIFFSIANPAATSVALVNLNDYDGNTHPGPVVVTFDDDAANNVAPTTPVAGTFNPAGTLASFNNTSPFGDWVLTLGDDFAADPLCLFSVSVIIEVTTDADISVTKTDQSGANTYVPGSTSTYQIVVSNNGPIDVQNLIVNDPLPGGATAGNWTCTAAAGANCDTAAGVGGINNVTVDIPNGSSVTFLLTVTWSTNPADYP